MRQLTFLLLFGPLLVSAQLPATNGYPVDYFRNPIDIPIFLAGNFGECRPGHFHSGMDIKTLGGENQPVHAAADGYISRIKMESGGFGHAIYITHPNGYTTLYAHLNKFAPAIQKFLVAQQYDQKKWNVDLHLTAAQFPVKKGAQIAWSGNTGASTAPHLHFEIRETKTEHPLNPQLFGLPVIDHLAPIPAELVLYTGSRINNYSGVMLTNESIYEGSSVTAAIVKKGAGYGLSKTNDPSLHLRNDTIDVADQLVGIALNVDDFMDGSSNTLAFHTAALYMDDSLQAAVSFDDIGYDESRYVNAYTDYKAKELAHKWVQCFFKQPGNRLDRIYTHLNRFGGLLDCADRQVHAIRISLTDNSGNSTVIAFFLKPGETTKAVKNNCRLFAWNNVNTYLDSNISFSLDDRQLYDDICFTTDVMPASDTWSNKIRIHDACVPLHHYFDLDMKASLPVPAALTGKMAMMYTDGKEVSGRAAVPSESGWYKAKVRNFGTYWLAADTAGPEIRALQQLNGTILRTKQIAFEVKDNMTSVHSFGGYLDGKWICFEQHASRFFYEMDEHCPKGKHKLVFRASDENGNESVYQLNFIK